VVAVWFLRRLAVIVVAGSVLAIRLIYVIALTLVDLFDGHLSADTPSSCKARVDRAYQWWLGMVERAAFLRRTSPIEPGDCSVGGLTRPR